MNNQSFVQNVFINISIYYIKINIYFHLLVFLLILFMFVHLVQQYKRSEDLEVYEMDFTDNQHLQEVCDIKQPVLFEYKSINTEFFYDINVDK